MSKSKAMPAVDSSRLKPLPREAAAPAVVTVQQVERATLALRVLLDAAAETLGAYEGEIAPIRDKYAPLIRRHGAEIGRAKDALLKLLGAAQQGLFGKVKSKVLHGIKLGWRKAPDVWGWPDDAALVALIKALCNPEEQAAFLVTTTVGRKDAINEAARKALGIGCTRGKDAAFINETAPSTGEALLALLAQLPEGAPVAGAVAA